MAPYYGQYQYPMYAPYGQSYNVPPKYNAGYMYGQPPAASQPPAKAQVWCKGCKEGVFAGALPTDVGQLAQGQQGPSAQAAGTQYGQAYGQGYGGGKQSGYGAYSQQQPPAQGNAGQGAPGSSFGGLQNRTASPSAAAPPSEDMYKAQVCMAGICLWAT